MKTFNANKLGVVKIYLEKKNFYKKLYESISISKSKTWKILAEQANIVIKKKFNRDIIFNNSTLKTEIKYHILGYLYSAGYDVKCPALFLLKAKSEYPNDPEAQRQYIKQHCKIIDISETDVYDYDQAIVFGYYLGIRSRYRYCTCAPYYDPVLVKRHPDYRNERWGEYELK